MALSSELGIPDDRSHTVIDLGRLINAILGFRPKSASDSELTDNGVVIRYDDDGIVGLTVLNASKR